MVIKADDRDLVPRIAAVLRRRELAIFPTDTVYGIHGLAPDTRGRIAALKGRREENPFLMLAPSAEFVEELAGAPLDPAVRSFWPGALTLVVNTPGGGQAIRVPGDPFLAALLAEVGGLVYSTSVNRSGAPHLWRIGEIVREFSREVELIVDAGDIPGGRPSTLLDVRERPYKLLRRGAVAIPRELLI